MSESFFEKNILYTHIFHRANDAFIVFTGEGDIIDTNAKACELYGYTREEFRSLRLEDLKPKNWNRRSLDEEYMREWKSTGCSRFDTIDVRKDGTEFSSEVSVSFFEEDGKEYILSIVREMVERRAYKELKRSEAIMNSIMASTATIYIWSVDADYRYTFFNNAHKEAMKDVWDADIEIGACILDYIPDPEYRDYVKSEYDLELQGQSNVTIDKFPDKAGKIRFYENIGSPIRNEQGIIYGLTLFTRDVTERMELQQELTNSLALQKSIMNSSETVIIYSVDLEFRYIFFNKAHEKAMQEIWGVTPSLGANLFDVLPKSEHHARALEQYQKALKGNMITSLDEFFDTHGIRRLFEKISTPIYNEKSELIGLTMFIQEVTDRLNAEEKVRESLKEKEILLKEIHHRVKNNMQVISSMFNMQIETTDNEEVKAQLSAGQNRVVSMALIHEHLYQSENLANIEISDYIRSLVSYLVDTYESYSDDVDVDFNMQRISLELDQAIPLGLIVNELVTNALKYAFKDRNSGRITITACVEDNGTVSISIEDNGIGLSEDFDIDSVETLGLQMVHALTQQLEGTIFIEQDKGTAVTIRFQYKN